MLWRRVYFLPGLYFVCPKRKLFFTVRELAEARVGCCSRGSAGWGSMSNVDLSLISTTVIEDSCCSLEENLRQELAADKIESLLHFFSSMRQSRASHDWSRSSSERRKLTTLQVPSEGMSGTRAHPQKIQMSWIKFPKMKQLFIAESVKIQVHQN